MIHNLIINASPLIVLGKAGLMKLISPLAKSWVIPESVIEEVSQKSSVDVILAQLSECSEVSCQKVSVINPLVAGWNLGKGESDVIALALDYSGYGVVLDDLQARKCAQIFDLPLTGTVGLLVKAKKEKLIDCVKPAFEKLVESGLYLDPQLIKRILASVGE